jgi:hypothetical protein
MCLAKDRVLAFGRHIAFTTNKTSQLLSKSDSDKMGGRLLSRCTLRVNEMCLRKVALFQHSRFRLKGGRHIAFTASIDITGTTVCHLLKLFTAEVTVQPTTYC